MPVLASSVIPKVHRAPFWLHLCIKPKQSEHTEAIPRAWLLCLHYKSSLWGRLDSGSSPGVYGLPRMNGALEGIRFRNALIIALWNNRLEGWIRIFTLAFIKSQRLSKTFLGEQLHLSFPLQHLSPEHRRILFFFDICLKTTLVTGINIIGRQHSHV